MAFKIEFKGVKKDKNDWQHFAWTATIGGQSFDYRTGVGHCYKLRNRYNNRIGNMPPVEKRKKNIPVKLDELTVYAQVPKIKDILYSIASDSRCAQDTFENFCSSFGYETDSRKALETYLACQENYHKLRRVMKSKNWLERIESWEL